MSLDAGDQARLRRIEAELAAADPAFADGFRRWRPAGAQGHFGPGWSTVPGWVLLVLLVGFTTWMVAPAVGAVVAVVAGCRMLRHWAHGRVRRGDRLWGRDGDDAVGRPQGTS